MQAEDPFMAGWQVAEILAPRCKCGSHFSRCRYAACVDLRGQEGWVEADGTWQLWCDGRAIVAIGQDRRITLWPHLGLDPLKTRPRTIDDGKRHILRWLSAKARASGLVPEGGPNHG